MFDIAEFIDECQKALTEAEPRRAVREALTRAMSGPAAVRDAMQPKEATFALLHAAPDLTVLHVVWAPGMELFPHNHQMWAAIGIYEGQEDNAFFRRDLENRGFLVESGGKELHTGDVVLLGDDTIHSVTNPRDRLTGSIHVYGGDFVNEPRSQWGPGERTERPYDIDDTRRQFADANARWKAN
ncbi:MAG: hypothetical protein ACT4OX_09750 [Actinomycetota bacterium]